MARKYLTVSEVADETRQSLSTVYTRIRNREFPSTRIGGRLVVPREELDRYMQANTTTAKQALDQLSES